MFQALHTIHREELSRINNRRSPTPGKVPQTAKLSKQPTTTNYFTSQKMSFIPGQPVTAVVQRVEIHKLRDCDNLILGFSIGGGIDQDACQNPFSEDKTDKGIYVTRVSKGGPADLAGLRMGDKIMQVNGWDMTMVTHDQARKKLTKKNEDVVRLLVTRKSLEEAVRQSKMPPN